MEEGNSINSMTGIGRTDSIPSLSADVEIKPTISSASGSEPSDLPSTSTGVSTVSTIPSIQQKKMKPFKLADAIKPIEYDEMQRMSKDSFNRILQAEGLEKKIHPLSIDEFLHRYLDVCETSGVGHVRKKTMTSLVCLSERSFRDSKIFQRIFPLIYSVVFSL